MMILHQEKFEQNMPKIEVLLNKWGIPQNGPTWHYKKADILRWLENFEPSEVDDAFLLMEKIQHHGENAIRETIADLSDELMNILGEDLKRSLFLPLGLSPSSSGAIFLYEFRHDLALSEHQFSTWPCKIDSDVRALVFFDDLIGSGSQAVRFFREYLSELRQKVLYVSLFAFARGLKRVQEDSGFRTVLTGVRLSDEYRAFTEDSMIFRDATQRLRIKSLAEKYGKRLYPSHPLGYDDTQSLVVFSHNTPNNTLPVIWAGSKNEKVVGERWFPLWERRWRSGATPKAAEAAMIQREIPASSVPAQTSFPLFRDIQIKCWQEIPLEERPHPFPPVSLSPPPPFQPKPIGEVDYVSGWNIRLRAGLRYQLSYDFGKNDMWPEIEIVLYQRVPRLNQGGELWKRAVSAGALSTSGEWPSEVTPLGDEWLVTCWGKTLIAWNAPWWAFVPEICD